MNQTFENALIERISPHEQMIHGGNLSHYFSVGRSAMACIRAGLAEAGRRADGPDPYGVRRILDLPCGQGRVMRNLRQAFPNAEITACDVSREGVDFCAETFGAVPIYSSEAPEGIRLPRDHFDLIWVGSLLTHFGADMWRRFLKLFHESLAPGGILIFTTHGGRVRDIMIHGLSSYGLNDRETEELLQTYHRDGFAYARFQTWDGDYGTSLSTTDWVVDRIREVDGLRLVMQQIRGWDDHQDCFTCQRGEPRAVDRRDRADAHHPASLARRALRLFSTRGDGRVRVTG